jgi:D-alanyl-D-alanine carboxypeptidase (penicillin-binding protein 5/6)
MKLLGLSLLSFLLISTTALSLSKVNFFSGKNLFKTEKSYAQLPVLSTSSSFPVVSAQGAFVVDLDSGVSLFEKDPDKKLFPASTTKIITALVAMDYFPRDYVVTINNIKIDGQKMGLTKGEELKISDLLYGLLVYSANDAAETIAQNFPGGREMFVTAMNIKAKQLFLNNSHFTNPSGLDENGHFSTARDLARVAEVAMKDPEFAQIVGTKETIVKSIDGKIKHKLVNINELLGNVQGVLGVKTGWTENARENLVTYIERDNHKIMISVLGSQDRFGETKEIINWIFANYKWEEVTLRNNLK